MDYGDIVFVTEQTTGANSLWRSE